MVKQEKKKTKKVKNDISKQNSNILLSSFMTKENIKTGSEMNKIASQAWDNIGHLNTQRGGLNGFIFEEQLAKEMNYKFIGTDLKARVIDDNGIVDILVENIKTGEVVEKIQAKCGYETISKSNVEELARYSKDGQKIVINKDAQKFSQKLDESNIKYEKSNITNKEVTKTAKAMKNETRLTNKKHGKFVATTGKTKEILKNSHINGVNAAKKGAAFGAGISIGNNIVELACGDKEFDEAVMDIGKDTIKAGVSGYE